MAASTHHPPHHSPPHHSHGHHGHDHDHGHGHHHPQRAPHRPTSQGSLPRPDQPSASLLALSLGARLLIVAALLALIWALLLAVMR